MIEKKITSKKVILYFIFFLSISSYSQKIFKEYGNREYSDTLNIELLHKVCENLKIKFSDVYTDKSHSIDFDSDKTFFALQYIISKETEHEEKGNFYEKKYLFANNSDGQVIDQINDTEIYWDQDAYQVYESNILKNKIKFSDDTIGVAISVQESVGGCAGFSSKQKLTIISLSNNKIIKLLSDFPIRKTSGQSNCAGNYEIEILEKSIELTKNKTNGFFDILVTKMFTYENVIEENLDKNIKGQEKVKNKTETEKLKFNGKNYDFKKDDTYRFLKW